MIRKILSEYAMRLNEYLSALHHQPEGLAEVGFVGNSSEEKPNKMVVSLFSIERETSDGISAPMQRTAEGYTHTSPPLLLNLNVVIAAVYDERRYGESLSVLSDTLRFIQSIPRFAVDGTDYTIEVVTLSTQDQNNVWTLLGGQYYPSVVCKLRRLMIDAEETTGSGATMKQPDLKMIK